jgi:DNA polymerase III epsilon subunit-like protein
MTSPAAHPGHGWPRRLPPRWRGGILVAHNASVERRVLAAHLPAWRPPLIFDTLRLAKTVCPNLDGYGLDRLVTHADITPPDARPGQRRHRASYDAWVTAALFGVLTEGLDWAQIVDAARLGATGDSEQGTTGRTGEAQRGLWW